MESATVKEISPAFLSGGGETGQSIREFDWSKSPLGPISSWPQSLCTTISVCLNSKFPMLIWWGPEMAMLYNDAYLSILGDKHPKSLGSAGKDVWPEIWDIIGPMLNGVINKGASTWSEDQLLLLNRHGYVEECYFTFSYSPIYDESGGIGGVFTAVTETTKTVLNERQLQTLNKLGETITDLKDIDEVYKKTIEALAQNQHDFPFALLYETNINSNKANLAGITEDAKESKIPGTIDLSVSNYITRIITLALAKNKPFIVEKISKSFGNTPKGSWQAGSDKAIIFPLPKRDQIGMYGFLIFGLNPYAQPDTKYLSFISLVADKITTSISNVHAYADERQRAEALIEINLAKTNFLSNISHEFRTPLTLILSPMEEILEKEAQLSEINRDNLKIVYRNTLRLQKLVNSLLDFSRIEAGRMEANFRPVDICSFTEELTAMFRPAIEKAGIKLITSFDKITEPVYLDSDMWEKIVMNLISNAFKYSNKGEIEVIIKPKINTVEFSVRDTGIGIPESELMLIFDRFYRVQNIQGRSQEGTGIGLSMVKELVKFHHGYIDIKSEVGIGTTVSVSIPSGKGQLSIINNTKLPVSYTSRGYVEEVINWISDESITEITKNGNSPYESTTRNNNKYKKILLVDDNADMRKYIGRILSSKFEVIVTGDGQEAFEKAIQVLPDLILSDIIMPKLNGYGFLKKLRSHIDTKNIPVIFLTAKTGEESKIEGLEAGVNDYLVKPFSANELLARIEGNIKISAVRRSAEQDLFSFLIQAPIAITILSGSDYIVELANEMYLSIVQRTKQKFVGRPIFETVPEMLRQGFKELFDTVRLTGNPMYLNEYKTNLFRNGHQETTFLNIVYQPIKKQDGEVYRIMIVFDEVTEQVKARKKIEESEKELNELANAMPQLVWIVDSSAKMIYYNNRVVEFNGSKKVVNGTWWWRNYIHPADIKATETAWKKALDRAGNFVIEHRLKMKEGEYRWHISRAIPQKEENGNVIKWLGTSTEIHESKEHAKILEQEVIRRTAELNELNTSLKQSNIELQQFAHVASHDLKEPLRKIKIFNGRLANDNQSVFSEKSQIYIDKIESATNRLFNMIEGVLDYSVLNNTEQNIEQINLNDLLPHIESDLELPISQKKATLIYTNLPVIEGAKVLIYQLFYNLINNSLKFSKPETPLIISITSTLIKINNTDFVKIFIEDNGIGFEQEYAEKIFDTFTRLNSKDKYEGTGLGLALCKRIVLRHSGTINAMGNIDKGAVFTIVLPVKQKVSLL